MNENTVNKVNINEFKEWKKIFHEALFPGSKWNQKVKNETEIAHLPHISIKTSKKFKVLFILL